MPLIALIDGFACATLLFVALEDARCFRIRNGAVLALVGLFALASWVSVDIRDLIWHGLFAVIVLVLMFGVFSLGLIGAGDAKLISAACLWIGPEHAVFFALVLLGLTALYGLGAKYGLLPARRDRDRTKIPFGPSISLAWIAVIALP